MSSCQNAMASYRPAPSCRTNTSPRLRYGAHPYRDRAFGLDGQTRHDVKSTQAQQSVSALRTKQPTVATESRLGLKTLTLKQYRRRQLSATAAVPNSDSDVSRHGGVVGLLLSGVAVALWRRRRRWTAAAQDRGKVRQSVTAWRKPWRQCMDVLTETGDLPLDGHRLLCGR